MREERRFALIAGLEAGTAFIRLGALALAAVSGHLTLLLAVIIVVLVALGKALYQSLQIRNSLRRRRCARLSLKAAWYIRRKLSEFWRLMRSGYLASTFIAPFKYGDVLLLGAFTSTSDVGLYKAAKTIVTLLQTACNTLAIVMFQDMNDALREGRPDHLRLILIRITKMWAPILILLVVLSIPIAPVAAEYIFGRDFVSGVPIFYVLFIGAVPGLLTFWSIQLAIATDVYGKALPLFYLTQLLNYILAIWLTWAHGAIGMAAAIGLHWTLSFIVFLPYSLPRISMANSPAVRL
jgi:O-antigen/teichoic acid export membrane protein